MNNQPPNDGSSGIRHTSPAIGQPADIPVPANNSAEDLIPVDEAPAGVSRKITAFGKEVRHEENWNRVPNGVDPSGNPHVHEIPLTLMLAGAFGPLGNALQVPAGPGAQLDLTEMLRQFGI